MKINVLFILISLTVLIGTSCTKSNTTDSPPIIDNEEEDNLVVEDIKILFIGASYFAYNDLPGLFDNFASSTNKNVFIEQRTVPGAFLEFHVTNEGSLDKINEEDWDYVILQGVGMNVAYPEPLPDYPYSYPSLFPSLREIYNQIKNNHSETTIIFCMPWAYEDGMTWLEGGGDTYEIMQQKIYDNTLGIKDSLDISIAPVGLAFNEIMSTTPPLHYLFLSDFNHPSERGTYLMACVLYASIFQENPELIDFYSDFRTHEADHFKEVANSVVFTDFDLWNIPSLQE